MYEQILPVYGSPAYVKFYCVDKLNVSSHKVTLPKFESSTELIRYIEILVNLLY